MVEVGFIFYFRFKVIVIQFAPIFSADRLDGGRAEILYIIGLLRFCAF